MMAFSNGSSTPYSPSENMAARVMKSAATIVGAASAWMGEEAKRSEVDMV
jgi:hypothetical protein